MKKPKPLRVKLDSPAKRQWLKRAWGINADHVKAGYFVVIPASFKRRKP